MNAEEKMDDQPVIDVAVIGVGHLGKEHARILSGLPGTRLAGVVDPNLAQARAVAERVGTAAHADVTPLLGSIQAAVVAAPTSLHHAIGLRLLDAGVSLLIEKPLALTTQQGRDLTEAARRNGLTLQVGHIERFNPAFELLASLPFVPRYITAERHGGFTGRSMDVGVVLDLMIHDLDLILALAGSPVARVEAMGAALLGGHEDLAQARVTFASGCVADLTACRVSPEGARRMRAWGPEGYVGVDFGTKKVTLMQPGQALTGIDSRRMSQEQAQAVKAGLFTRYVEATEADCSQRHAEDQLTRELRDFVECVRTGRRPRVDGEAGLAALDLACQITGCLRAAPMPTPLGRLFTPPLPRAAA
jgi:predicted dehydrogenase